MHPSKAEKIHRLMHRVPHWLLTILCLAAILYLTLSPDPLGEEDLPLFEGADKLAHGLMFFSLVLCALFDAMRARGWRKVPLPGVALITLLGMGLGIGIEYLQQAMGLGRGFEIADMAADAVGAVIGGTVWIFFAGFLRTADSGNHTTSHEN